MFKLCQLLSQLNRRVVFIFIKLCENITIISNNSMEKDSNNLTYANIIRKFLEHFPEFQEAAQEQAEWWQGETGGEPLAYIFFGDVVNPILVKELTTMKGMKFLENIFTFFEKMATSNNIEIVQLLQMGTLEILGDNKKILKNARKLMQSNTLKLSHEIEKLWGRE